MAKKIIFSKKAERNFDNIATYLNNEFGLRTAQEFIIKVYDDIDLIILNPKMFPVSKVKEVRKCVINKNSILYFIIKTNEIRIIAIKSAKQSSPR